MNLVYKIAPIFILSLFLCDCGNLLAEQPPMILSEEQEVVVSTCNRVCDVLNRSDCPEGTYDMCNHSKSNDCIKIMNVGCVMKAKNRQEIISCGVKCEW